MLKKGSVEQVAEDMRREQADKINWGEVIPKIPQKKRKELFRKHFKPTPSEQYRKKGKRVTIDNI